MAYFIEQRCATLKGVEEKGLMIRTHGHDQIRRVQKLRGHPALVVMGGINPPLQQIGAYVWMHLLRDGHCPSGAHTDRRSAIEPRFERVFCGHAAKDVTCT